MEDSHYCGYPLANSELGLFCVFDGHAGKDCAIALTKIFPEVFLQEWKNIGTFPSKRSLITFWNSVYQQVDDKLKNFEYQGSTATTLLLFRTPEGKPYMQCVNIGDSGAYMQRDGKIIELTRAHKLSCTEERIRIETMGVELTGAQSRITGLGITRAFGDFFPKEIGSGIISEPYSSDLHRLSPKDTHIIIATDGLWDVMSASHAFDLIADISDVTQAANRLLQAALINKSDDNITIIVIKINL